MPPDRDVQVHHLTGLGKSMSPVAAMAAKQASEATATKQAMAAMEAMEGSSAKAQENVDIRQSLRMSAITIYTHERVSNRYHSRVSTSSHGAQCAITDLCRRRVTGICYQYCYAHSTAITRRIQGTPCGGQDWTERRNCHWPIGTVSILLSLLRYAYSTTTSCRT